MKNQEEHIKKYLVWFLLGIWFIPWLQGDFHFIHEARLHGAIETKYNPILDEKAWIEGRFQKYKEDYLNSEFGFRPYFIKLNNQFAYSVLGNVHAKYIVQGKDGYLFEYNYIKAFYGRDFIGENQIDLCLRKVKKIQDSLAQHGKTFLFVVTASKGQYCSEFFPDSSNYAKSISNYEVFSERAKALGINYIDFNSYFLDLKKNATYPLYSKYGVHWTNYGACIAADSIIHYLEQKRNVDMPELFWDSIQYEPARKDDRDIELALNLIFPMKTQMLAYPKVHYESADGKQKPSVMVIADSYYWSLFNLKIFNSFSKNQFWYYYSKIYEDGINGFKMANDTRLKQALDDFDVVLLMGADINLYNIGWGFIDNAEQVLDHNPHLGLEFQQKLENLKAYIPTDSSWIRDVRRKAIDNGISVDSMVTLDAIWILEHDKINH